MNKLIKGLILYLQSEWVTYTFMLFSTAILLILAAKYGNVIYWIAYGVSCFCLIGRFVSRKIKFAPGRKDE